MQNYEITNHLNKLSMRLIDLNYKIQRYFSVYLYEFEFTPQKSLYITI